MISALGQWKRVVVFNTRLNLKDLVQSLFPLMDASVFRGKKKKKRNTETELTPHSKTGARFSTAYWNTAFLGIVHGGRHFPLKSDLRANPGCSEFNVKDGWKPLVFHHLYRCLVSSLGQTWVKFPPVHNDEAWHLMPEPHFFFFLYLLCICNYAELKCLLNRIEFLFQFQFMGTHNHIPEVHS